MIYLYNKNENSTEQLLLTGINKISGFASLEQTEIKKEYSTENLGLKIKESKLGAESYQVMNFFDENNNFRFYFELFNETLYLEEIKKEINYSKENNTTQKKSFITALAIYNSSNENEIDDVNQTSLNETIKLLLPILNRIL